MIQFKWCLLAPFFLLPMAAHAEDGGPTARGMFMLLPDSIFESTLEGLDEASKQELALDGRSSLWEITEETPDTLVFTGRAFADHNVRLQMFRDLETGDVQIALGANLDNVCVLELWKFDTLGRLEMQDLPPEPPLGDYFSNAASLPARIGNESLICLDSEGLHAVPLFWDSYGMLPARPENEVRFAWNGHSFEKVVRPAPKNRAPLP